MKPEEIINQLEYNIDVYKHLLLRIPENLIKWKPAENIWCLLEIVSHLYDEEREDFRARLDKILSNDNNWNPIDPAGWVTSRNYIYNDYMDTVEKFLFERRKSIKFLRTLDHINWKVKVFHPKFGEFVALNMLCSWLAHDYLHVRQIIKTKYLFLNSGLASGDLRYAGEW
ncbi:MAG: hypothetical protein HGGPFJEG_02782 [Ignavibacteria bacterium]|nr:hypothetical protein [Ignavibacteria bacterium]